MEPQNDASKLTKLNIAALVFAMVFPTCMSLLEFVILPGTGEHNPAVQAAFIGGKAVQFLFPFVFVWITARHLIRIHRPRLSGMSIGLLFGVVVSLGIFVLYFVFLRGTDVFGDTPEKVYNWLSEFNVTSRTGFFLIAVFISVPHSFLEEYYWRWFVFGGLQRYIPFGVAIVVSSLAFMSHHVVVLSVYLPGHFWTAVVPFSLCTAVGGGVWAWLYHKYDSLYPPWISHLLVDIALMVVGYDLLAKYWN